MRVRIINQLYDAPAVGTEVDVEQAKAEWWIKAGIAEPAPEPTIERAIEPAAETPEANSES